MIILNNTNISEKLVYFMYLTNSFGKPTPRHMKEFIYNFKEDFVKGDFAKGMAPDRKGASPDEKHDIKVNRKKFETLWSAILTEVPEAHRDGGYDWYVKISELDFAGKTDEQMAEMLQNVYVIEKPVPTPVQNINSPMNDEQALEANYIQRLLNNKNNKVPEAEHADVATEADTAKATEKSNTAEQSHTAHVAEELSDAGTEKLLALMEEKQQKQKEEIKKDLSYTPQDLGTYTTSVLLYNNSKLEDAIQRMEENHTLYILGNTNSGKTYMCKELAARKCNIDYAKIKDSECEGSNFLMISSSVGKDKFIGTKNENGMFPKFCEYNKNSEFCLLMINEAEKNATESILSPLWEKLKNFRQELQNGITIELPTGIQVEIPKNLYIIANVAANQYDDQMYSRFRPVIDLDAFDISDAMELSEATGIPQKLMEMLIELNIEIRRQTSTNTNKYKNMESILTISDLIRHKNGQDNLQDVVNAVYKLVDIAEGMFGNEWEPLAKELKEYAEGMLHEN